MNAFQMWLLRLGGRGTAYGRKGPGLGNLRIPGETHTGPRTALGNHKQPRTAPGGEFPQWPPKSLGLRGLPPPPPREDIVFQRLPT